jgi:hypothetical protein
VKFKRPEDREAVERVLGAMVLDAIEAIERAEAKRGKGQSRKARRKRTRTPPEGA